jgi:hypothetical protein
MRLVANDQSLFLGVKKLAARTAVVKQRVAQMLQHAFELLPLNVCRRWTGAQPFQRFLVFGHALYSALATSVTKKRLRKLFGAVCALFDYKKVIDLRLN